MSADEDMWAVADQLRSLVDRNLVQAEHHGSAVRYRLLETIREYGVTKLAERVRNGRRDSKCAS